MGEDARVPYFKKVVLTGGPCGGKTTALAEVSERLRSFGLQVFIQPEVSTLLSSSGAGFPAAHGPEYRHAWEAERLRFQLAMEETFAGIARASRRQTVLLCDRGAGDAAAYNEASAWPAIAAAAVGAVPQGARAERLLVERYDLVLHLVSAAIGAREHYTLAGNTARRETADEAVVVDRAILAAWDSHPHRRVVDNSTDFEGKIRRVVTMICNDLGVLSPTAARKRFAVSRARFAPPPGIVVEEFSMTYTFLAGSTDAENSCVRERVDSTGRRSITYSRRHANGMITERPISGREANALYSTEPDQQVHMVRKRRVFVANEMYFELDDHDNLECVLAVEVLHEEDYVEFPDWLEPAVIKKISKENAAEYSLFRMALRTAASSAATTKLTTAAP